VSGFLSALRVEQIEDTSHDGRGTWTLIDPLVYDSDVAGKVITVPTGFVTDFASVPRVPFAYWIAGDVAHPAAVVHDWLYSSHEVDRPTADAVLEEAANVADCLPVPLAGNADVIDQTERYNDEIRSRSRLMKWMVRMFGGSNWDQPGPPQPDSVKALLPA
jgi:hypothetical protein